MIDTPEDRLAELLSGGCACPRPFSGVACGRSPGRATTILNTEENSGEQLRAIDEVIAVAGGRRKTAAVRSVLLSGHAKSLVTDTALASELLAGL